MALALRASSAVRFGIPAFAVGTFSRQREKGNADRAWSHVQIFRWRPI